MSDVALLRPGAGLTTAFVAATLLAGCGGGSKNASNPASAGASKPATTAPTTMSPAAKPRPRSGHVSRSRGVSIRVPRGWHDVRPRTRAKVWPVPLRATASFRLPPLHANASCSKAVIDALRASPHGVYMLIAEYTKPQPHGFPSPPPIGPRPNLAHLDLRPAEVECWDDGLSGAARFTDHGRAFYAELLLGRDVTAAERRKALRALASLRVGRA
jgi:hypothetical protein